MITLIAFIAFLAIGLLTVFIVMFAKYLPGDIDHVTMADERQAFLDSIREKRRVLEMMDLAELQRQREEDTKPILPYDAFADYLKEMGIEE